MRTKYLLIPLSLVFGLIFFGFFGLALAAIFALIWFDKILLWFLGSFGIELTTISMLLIGISYGPFVGFFFVLLVLPLLEGMKTFYLPVAQSDWPAFVPTPYHLLDGVIVTLAWFMKDNPLLLIMVVALLVKYPSTAMIDNYFIGKPPNLLRLLLAIVFNLILVVYLSDVFVNIMSL
jgi:hypothetical protein